jgi:hypothetical protein
MSNCLNLPAALPLGRPGEGWPTWRSARFRLLRLGAGMAEFPGGPGGLQREENLDKV